MKGAFTINGLEEYLAAIEAAGRDVDEAVAEGLQEAAPLVTDKMHDLLRQSSEAWTGETDATIKQSEVQREGNYTFVEISAGGTGAPQAFYKEFGRARQAAEPFFRPAFGKMRHLWRNALKQVLTRMGVPS